MIFEISGHKVNHFTKANYLVFVQKVHTAILPYFKKHTLHVTQCRVFLDQKFSVDSMENNFVIPSLLFGSNVLRCSAAAFVP